MRALFRRILLLLIVLGVAGQSLSFAATPCPMMHIEQASAKAAPMPGMANCNMEEHKTGPQNAGRRSVPLKEMTLECCAMAGCVGLVAQDSAIPAIHARPVVASLGLWPATSVLLGRTIVPELDPPLIPG